ncbi:MAG: ribosome-associated translation inhibitor RaiA [bacterium]|jgi:putative sigma-54 modulation protein
MQVEISGSSITPRLDGYIRKKVEKLSKYFSRAEAARVELTQYPSRHNGRNFRFEVTVDVARKFVRAEEYGASFEEACDLAMEKVEKQLKRYKTKLIDKYRGQGDGEPEIEQPADETRKVAKIKRFHIKPMTTEEAIMQFDLSGHDFFVFEDQASGSYNVLYKRSNGTLGLLVPDR